MVAISSAFILKYIIDATTTLDINLLYGAVKVVLIYLVFVFSIGYTRRICRAKYLHYVLMDLKNELFNGLINNNITTFMKNNSALYISVFNNDLKVIEDDYIDNFFNIVSNIYTYVIAVAFMFYLNSLIALTSIILSIFPLLIPNIFAKKLAGLKQGFIKSLEIYNIKIRDFFAGFEIIKSFNIVRSIEKNHSEVNGEVENRKYRFNSINAIVDAVSNILSVFMQFAVYLITGFLVITKGLNECSFAVVCNDSLPNKEYCRMFS